MKSSAARQGVSLLEVLISIFVLTLGLLSLAALIPVGRFTVRQANQADSAAACGRACLREIKVRGMLQPHTWHSWRSGTFDPVIASILSPLPQGKSFAIDPLLYARHYVDTNSTPNKATGAFPYIPTGNQPAMPWMQRVTWESVLADNSGSFQISLPLAERCFMWRDDLQFPLPEDPTHRPRLLVQDSNGMEGGLPEFPSEVLLTAPFVPSIGGDYTWLVTVTPARAEEGLIAQDRQLYSVSIVVFYKRDLNVAEVDPNTGLQNPTDLTVNPKPSERTVTANILGVGVDGNNFGVGTGYGGGSVKLSVRSPDTTAPETKLYTEYLSVKENEWLMFCGNLGASSENADGVFHWYRVISVGDVFSEPAGSNSPDRICRLVTLAGPDWPAAWCAKNDSSELIDLDGDGVSHDVEAALMDGVIGVYSTTIEIDD